jgi:hypothetical protein
LVAPQHVKYSFYRTHYYLSESKTNCIQDLLAKKSLPTSSSNFYTYCWFKCNTDKHIFTH